MAEEQDSARGNHIGQDEQAARGQMRLEDPDRGPAKGQPAVGLRVEDGDGKKGGEIGPRMGGDQWRRTQYSNAWATVEAAPIMTNQNASRVSAVRPGRVGTLCCALRRRTPPS
ncbi:hypothetical protein MBT84_45545 [Streptomyces sp. MBT84]|nr:hypothetical protein [Streptomyces sp. MBT84]